MSLGVYNELLKDVKLPKMYKVNQEFDRTCILNITEKVRKELLSFSKISLVRGKTVALAVGSRGIKHITEIVKTVVDTLQDCGAEVFIVPAMGSHGGAIAENQKKILEHLGITENAIGVPIKATMDTDCIGYTPDGIPVYFDRNANQADYTISIARIKPHCSFRGIYESGMVKMSGFLPQAGDG